MKPSRSGRLYAYPFGVALAVLCVVSSASAQFTLSDQLGRSGFEGLGTPAGGQYLTVEAAIVPADGSRPAVLLVSAEIQAGYHIYSIDQQKDAKGGGPEPTRIRLEESPDYRLAGAFRAHPAPATHVDQTIWIGLELEEHQGRVTWLAPLDIADDVDLQNLTIQGTLDALACSDSNCVPVPTANFVAQVGTAPPGLPLDELTQSVTATVVSQPTPQLTGPTTSGYFQRPSSALRWTGVLEPARVPPSGSATLAITASPQPNWHIYALADRADSLGPRPTLIQLETTSGLTAGKPTTSAPVEKKDQSDIGFGIVELHHQPVTWKLPIHVPASAAEGIYSVAGVVGGMACEESGQCEVPQGARFVVQLEVSGASPAGGSTPLTFAAASYNDAAKLANSADPAAPLAPTSVSPETPLSPSDSSYDLKKINLGEEQGSLIYYLVSGFIGGLILNLMPCVLPVIGLKLMSFVQQAGQSRSKALVLNIWYSLGIISVFLVLAWLAVSANLAWGEQFGSPPFNVTITAIVFAMALSLLGVWEIPIPGFIGGSTSGDLASKEGPLGAFLKGVITTILATPCTGPFMAAGLAWAVSQPTSVTFAVFFAVGAGMASPYLIVGAFPSLIRFLPKPGMWMVTFKQIMGFVLLGTVVFLLSFLPITMVVPTTALLVGVGVGCWWISRTPLTEGAGPLLHAWTVAGLWIAISAMFSFGILHKQVIAPREARRVDKLARAHTTAALDQVINVVEQAQDTTNLARAVRELKHELSSADNRPWQEFTLARLGELTLGSGQTVLVDFSADWCFNCKTLEATVLHTSEVESAIQQGGVVTMYADFTHRPASIEETLTALGSNGVPVIAIFPGNAPYRPIVFRGVYTKDGLIEAITRATGTPSLPNGSATASHSAAAKY